MRPRVIPAWGYGFRGNGVSYHSRARNNLPGLREADHVAFVAQGTPSFQQTDGRDYRDDEQIAVRLESGDWLEFEVTGLASPAEVNADGCMVTLTERGFRVTATGPVELLRVTLG